MSMTNTLKSLHLQKKTSKPYKFSKQRGNLEKVNKCSMTEKE